MVRVVAPALQGAVQRPSIGRTAAVLLCAGALIAPCGGCKLLAFILPEQTKDIPAEYPYLPGKSVAIVVRANVETLALYPHVQWEVADHVRLELEGKVRGVTVVEPRTVTDLQRSNPDWAEADPADLGKRFNAERLIELELTQYTTREPGNEYLYRGHITAALRIFNTAYPRSLPAFQTHVRTVYPSEGPGRWGTDDRTIRRELMELFAQDVVNKFYDRTVPVRQR